MRVLLKNVGTLDVADFETKELTIICGENNTGKTYATYSLYGFLSDEIPLYRQAIEKLKIEKLDDFTIKLTLESLTEFLKYIDENSHFERELPRILAIEEEKLKDATFKETSISNLIQKMRDESFDATNFFKENFSEFELALSPFNIFDGSCKFKNYDKKEKCLIFECHEKFSERASNVVLNLAVLLLTQIYPNVFIVSAERTGASMFYKELDINKNELLKKINEIKGDNIQQKLFDLLHNSYSTYPKPVEDNIYFVRKLDEIIKKEKSFIVRDKNDEIHKRILSCLSEIVGGDYVAARANGGVEFVPKARKRVRISLQQASSSVRSLLILSTYILHKAKKGDLLMIDEPELNLHPKNQILVARLLVLLVNAGVSVFITTHSDYILREVSSCISLYNLSDEEADSFYGKALKLDAQKVAAYEAKVGRSKGKNVLEKMEITQRDGIFVDTFNEAIEWQNENQDKIYERVLRAENLKAKNGND